MLHRFRPSFHSLLALVGLIPLLTLQSEKFSVDPGTGWHLKGGEIMRTAHTDAQLLPWAPLYHDPFLALPQNEGPRAWICDQWLSDIILSLWFDHSGFSGLNLFFAGVFICTFFVLLYRSVLRNNGGLPQSSTITFSPIAYSLATLLAFKLAQVHFILRPVVFSFPLFVLVWSRARRGVMHDAPCKKELFIYPAIFVLWANLHPSFLFGIIWLAIGALFALARRNRTKFVKEATLTAACLGATLLTPYGPALHKSIFALTGSKYFMQMHQEWLPPQISSPEGQFLIAVVIFSLCGCGLFLWQRRRGELNRPQIPGTLILFDLLSSLFMLILACRSVRTLPIFGVVSTPVFYYAIVGVVSLLVALVPKRTQLSAAWRNLNAREGASLHKRLWPKGAVILSTATILLSLSPNLPTIRGFIPSIQQAGYPTPLITSLAAQSSMLTQPSVVFALPAMGGMISLYGYPAVKAVIDDRNTLLGESFYREYFAARDSISAFNTFTAKYRVTHVLAADHEVLPVARNDTGALMLVERCKEYSLYRLQH